MDICKKLIEFESELKEDMRYVSTDPELVSDSYQDAYIKVHKYVDKGKEFYGNDASIKSLLKLTCRNILIDKLRKIQKDKILYTDETYSFIDYHTPEDSFVEMEQTADDPFITKKLNSAFSNMSHDTYMTYRLRQKGIKFKDVAYLTDTSLNTALGRMRYAQIKIENEFNNERN
jgi:RNA polymerase sigma-70 factor (ECF subfamily)